VPPSLHVEFISVICCPVYHRHSHEGIRMLGHALELDAKEQWHYISCCCFVIGYRLAS
jgi:hypothetical protein